MSVLDIVILVFLGIGAYSGYKKGLLLELVSLSAFFIAIIAGIKLLDSGVRLLAGILPGYENVLPFVVFILIFLVIILVLNAIGKTVKKILDMTLLGSIDDLAGSLLGILKWSLVISIFFWIFGSLGLSMPDSIVNDSFLYDPVTNIAPGLFELVSGIFPFIHEFFEKTQEFVQERKFTAYLI